MQRIEGVLCPTLRIVARRSARVLALSFVCTACMSSSADAQCYLKRLPAARKEMGMVGGRKRLPAEVQRTLESIYRRTPFPSDDMVR